MDRAYVMNSLLVDDGSCRDINFSQCISTHGAKSLLDTLSAFWTLTEATDAEGEDVADACLGASLSRQEGALRTLWHGPGLLRDLQAFLYWPAHDQVFCELTFFPEALDVPGFTLEGLLTQLATFVRVTGSREYYVRFENAAWRHGCHDRDQGVILSHLSVPLPLA
ncbi:hypothetical protein [Massilia phyllosphaerae]|uniref:hypothetical protein n=1 Tax=Massilia phyllosphaerae TaxID=3106034 RepID=UPI002B1CD4B5|nr:hypothetical protein [Massilia sp. SGZ-792]